MRDQKEPFVFTPGVLGYPILFVLMIWVVFWIEIRFGVDFTKYGIYPMSLEGLRGILFSPFIHSDIKHLFNNSIPLFILGMSLFYFYRSISWQILFLGILFSGLITWGIGRPAYHIGASGIIYVLVSFLFFKGIFSRYYRLVALSLIVVFLYGGMWWYVTPIDPTISWEGHLAGLITGFAFSLIYRKKIARAPKFSWEEERYREEDDPFMRHFDEQGNFIENPDNTDPDIVYHYKRNKED